jgi:hypothetical protein
MRSAGGLRLHAIVDRRGPWALSSRAKTVVDRAHFKGSGDRKNPPFKRGEEIGMTINGTFILVAALIAIVAVGTRLIMIGSENKNRAAMWSAFRVHLGTALLISAITIVLVDVQIQREFESQISQIPNGMRQYVCNGDAGLEAALNKQIVGDPIRYSDIEIQQKLRLGKNADRVVSMVDTEFNVENTGKSDIPWNFSPTVTTDFEDDPDIRMDKPIVREKGRDEDVTDPSYQAKFNPVSLSGPEIKVSWTMSITLKPGVVYTVLIRRQADDRLMGYMTHFFTKVNNGIRYTLDADPELFDAKIDAYCPSEEEKNKPDSRVPVPVRTMGALPALHFQISQTLLPYQGVEVHWRYRRPPTSRNEGDQGGENHAPDQGTFDPRRERGWRTQG